MVHAHSTTWGVISKQIVLQSLLYGFVLDTAGEMVQYGAQQDMYIPTQEERYSKVAKITLFMCVVVPSGIVLWAYGNEQDLLSCAFAFLEPPAFLLRAGGCGSGAAFALSAVLQALLFFAMSRSSKLTAKGKLTLAATWGMAFALVLRVLIAWQFWVAAGGGQAAG